MSGLRPPRTCRIFIVALLVTLLAAVTLALQPDKPIMQKNWQTERGLPQNSVNAICQTRDGYLW